MKKSVPPKKSESKSKPSQVNYIQTDAQVAADRATARKQAASTLTSSPDGRKG